LGSRFDAAVEEKPAGWFTIRHRIRVVKRHPEGDWLSLKRARYFLFDG